MPDNPSNTRPRRGRAGRVAAAGLVALFGLLAVGTTVVLSCLLGSVVPLLVPLLLLVAGGYVGLRWAEAAGW